EEEAGLSGQADKPSLAAATAGLLASHARWSEHSSNQPSPWDSKGEALFGFRLNASANVSAAVLINEERYAVKLKPRDWYEFDVV
ncbi:hypothetical protein, partial [Escherichia coli]|uniref:hypothetical protein n=1 Tax=Escherichia coli TaxID=562 RepID=UPI0028DDAEDB